MADQEPWDRVVAGHFVLEKRSFWPDFFSRLVARLQWDPMAVDLTRDVREWAELPAERRTRLLKVLAGFEVGEGAVAEQIAPYADAARKATLASQESLMAWVFFLQRRDEARHAQFFDRIAAEVLALPGDTADERRGAAPPPAPPGVRGRFAERPAPPAAPPPAGPAAPGAPGAA